MQSTGEGDDVASFQYVVFHTFKLPVGIVNKHKDPRTNGVIFDEHGDVGGVSNDGFAQVANQIPHGGFSFLLRKIDLVFTDPQQDHIEASKELDFDLHDGDDAIATRLGVKV